MKLFIILLFYLIILISGQDNSNNSLINNDQTVIGHGLSWNYVKNGADWVGMGTCGGQEQSPIDIQAIKGSGSCDNTMQFDWQPADKTIKTMLDASHGTIKLMGPFSHLYATDVDGNFYGYVAEEFHMHAPAEHKIDGKQYDLSINILHVKKSEFETSKRDHAIITINWEIDDNQPGHNFWNELDPSSNRLGTEIEFNFKKALAGEYKTDVTYYHYMGSITKPPCSETVNWYVLEKSLKMTSAQLRQFTKLWSGSLVFANGNGNNREIQELNGRKVKKGGIKCEEQFVYFFSFFILYIFINYFIFKLL